MSKLVDSPVLAGKLVHSWTEPCHRELEPGVFNPERHRFVVDEQDMVLGTVTDKYKLVTNREFVSALDVAADALNMEIAPKNGDYFNGRSRYTFALPEYALKIGRDPSETVPTVTLRNNYGGNGGLWVLVGWLRLVCTNGLVIGEVAHRDMRRHVGKFDLYEFVRKPLEKVIERVEIERMVAEALTTKQYMPERWDRGRVRAQENIDSDAGTFVDRILADTAERYHADLARAVRENSYTIGNNLWAVAQAVAEIATHRMQQRADGAGRAHHNFAADDWASRQYATIRRAAGIK